MDFKGAKVVVTGGAGFIGSHAAEAFAALGASVTIFDNLSRASLLKKAGPWVTFNWDYLAGVKGVTRVKGDVTDVAALDGVIEGADLVVHCAAQTAVTTSVVEPREDFLNNALGTFNVLDAARRKAGGATLIYCSTNKVYGDNVNAVPVNEAATRYSFGGNFTNGIPEDFPLDAGEHTPYGCSKLAGDAYARDFAKLYGIRSGVFRMSCIYGERQFGVEDQGWLAHFAVSTIRGKPVTVFGDGKQVRDVLYVGDLMNCFTAFASDSSKHAGEPFNIGGGAQNTLSLLELMVMLEELTGKKINASYSDWRPADQRVYVSDISKAKARLGWSPAIAPEEGVKRLVNWISANAGRFG